MRYPDRAHTFSWKDDSGGKHEEFGNGGEGGNKKDFPYLSKRVQLVVFIQISSCVAESVYPKLNKVKDQWGCHLLEDIIETRVLMMCNGSLSYI